MAEKDPIIAKMNRLLMQYDGVFLGEVHYKPDTLNWLKEHMSDMHEAGVTRLYIEHVPAEKQEYLDQYMADFPGAREALRHNGMLDGFRSEEYMQVLDAAKHAGIRLVAIDHSTVAQAEQKDLADINYNDEGLDYRVRTSNPFWKKIIKGDFADAEPEERYAIWGGLAHSHKSNGIDALLGIPSIDLIDGLSLKLTGNMGTAVPTPKDENKLLGSKPLVYSGNKLSDFAAYIPHDKVKFASREVTPDPFTDDEFKLYAALTFNLDTKSTSRAMREELQDVVDVLVAKSNALRDAPDELTKELGDLTPHLPRVNREQAQQIFKPRTK